MREVLSAFLLLLNSVVGLWHEHPGVAEALWGLGLQLIDLHHLWIRNFFALLFWQAGHNRLLAKVLLKVSD